MHLFRSAYLRLTLWYLAVIMIISVFFSIALYRVSAQELTSNLRQEGITIQHYPIGINNPSFMNLRQQEDATSRQHIELNLIYFNFFILILGGAASYLLARHTLEPIEDALEAQTRFTADASHQLRTPLTAMKSEIEVALRGDTLKPQEARDLLKSNLEEVNKLEALSNGLLRLAQYQSGERDLAWERCNAPDLVQAAIERATRLKGRELDQDIRDVHFEGNTHALKELLVVLLDNAAKYSPADSTIFITANTHAQHVRFTVRNSGKGIAAADLPSIFNRFYRASSAQTIEGNDGYGLGLSIAQKVVELHNGTISVQSDVDEDTIFTVLLPFKQTKRLGIPFQPPLS